MRIQARTRQPIVRSFVRDSSSGYQKRPRDNCFVKHFSEVAAQQTGTCLFVLVLACFGFFCFLLFFYFSRLCCCFESDSLLLEEVGLRHKLHVFSCSLILSLFGIRLLHFSSVVAQTSLFNASYHLR